MPYYPYRQNLCCESSKETSIIAERNVKSELGLTYWKQLPPWTKPQAPAEESEDEDKSITDTFAPVEYKQKEYWEGPMKRHKEIEPVDDNKLNTDWWGSVSIGAQCNGNRQENLDTLAQFQEMWDNRLACIEIAKHRIERSTCDNHPLNSTLNRPGPEASKI